METDLSSNERAQATVIAERLLEEPYADPDSDACVLARQFNRSQEEIERLRALLTPMRWDKATSDAWHRAIPDMHLAFAALRELGTVETPATADHDTLTEAEWDDVLERLAKAAVETLPLASPVETECCRVCEGPMPALSDPPWISPICPKCDEKASSGLCVWCDRPLRAEKTKCLHTRASSVTAEMINLGSSMAPAPGLYCNDCGLALNGNGSQS